MPFTNGAECNFSLWHERMDCANRVGLDARIFVKTFKVMVRGR